MQQQQQQQQQRQDFFTFVPPRVTASPFHQQIAHAFQKNGVKRVIAFGNSDFEKAKFTLGTGYTAFVDANSALRRALFDNVDVGFGVSVFDVQVPDGWMFEIPEEERAQARRAINVLIPDVSPRPPTLSSTENDYWVPSLGRGGRIGLVMIPNSATAENEWQLLVYAGLDPSLLTSLSNEWATMEVAKAKFSDALPLMQRMAILGDENRKRLAALFVGSMRLHIKSAVKSEAQTATRVVGTASAPSASSAWRTLEDIAQAREWFEHHVTGDKIIPAWYVVPNRAPQLCEEKFTENIANLQLGLLDKTTESAIFRYEPIQSVTWSTLLKSNSSDTTELQWFNQCVAFESDRTYHDYGVPNLVRALRSNRMRLSPEYHGALPIVWARGKSKSSGSSGSGSNSNSNNNNNSMLRQRHFTADADADAIFSCGVDTVTPITNPSSAPWWTPNDGRVSIMRPLLMRYSCFTLDGEVFSLDDDDDDDDENEEASENETNKAESDEEDAKNKSKNKTKNDDDDDDVLSATDMMKLQKALGLSDLQYVSCYVSR